MLSYVLTGNDDVNIVQREKKEIVQARSKAQRSLVDRLLKPVEKRLALRQGAADDEEAIQRIDTSIDKLSTALANNDAERDALLAKRKDLIKVRQHADSQIIAIDEMLTRYKLLDRRYASDLERLDFVSEGAYFFGGLQDTICPICNQNMKAGAHDHDGETAVEPNLVHEAATAEASKIRGLQRDLQDAISDLEDRKSQRCQESEDTTQSLRSLEIRISNGPIVPWSSRPSPRGDDRGRYRPPRRLSNLLEA